MNAVAPSPLVDSRFLLLEAVGRGGMGRVYRAFDRAEQRLVALKVLAEPDEGGSTLAAEFEAWSRLKHPNIVRALELGRAERGPFPEGTPYLVLEHVSGPPVHRRFAPGRVPAPLFESIARQLLAALDHVHRAGLVHRDLKPGNVLAASARGRGVRIKLTDFGLAAEAGVAREPGRLSGSLPYVAPESILGRPLDGRADLYGLGILLHYLASGVLPSSGSGPAEVLRWHLRGERPDVRGTVPSFPDRLARFVARLTARSIDERPSSAAEALALLGDARSVARRSSPADRFDRARVRLAVDAVRRGEARVLELSAKRSGAAAAVREARVRAQVHGVDVHRITAPRAHAAASSLGRVVLRLLLSRGPEIRDVIRRHGLERGLPLEILGGLPVWDRVREERFGGALDATSLHATAFGVAGFLWESCRGRPRAFVVDRGALTDPLTAEVVRLLRRRAEERNAAPGAGLLLLLPRGGRVNCRTTPPTRATGA